MNLSDFILSWKQSDSNIVGFIMRYIKSRALYHCNVLTTGNVVMRGMRNMRVDGRLSIGIGNAAFSLPSDKTYLLIDGTLESRGMTRISRGCRVQIAKDASLMLDNCFINCDTRMICTHGISIGAGSAIGWGCQFCDEDFHSLEYANAPIITTGGVIRRFVTRYKLEKGC